MERDREEKMRERVEREGDRETEVHETLLYVPCSIQ
jgi:hypothetical protein